MGKSHRHQGRKRKGGGNSKNKRQKTKGRASTSEYRDTALHENTDESLDLGTEENGSQTTYGSQASSMLDSTLEDQAGGSINDTNRSQTSPNADLSLEGLGDEFLDNLQFRDMGMDECTGTARD